MWQLRQKHKQTNIRPTILFERENFRLKKKTGAGQVPTQDLRRTRHFRYLQAKLAGNAYKFELIMNQDTNASTDFVKLVVNTKNSTFRFDNTC